MTTLRVGFVTGSTPDKWARIWRERYPGDPLDLTPLDEATQVDGLRDHALDLALVRLPIDRAGLHCIPLYDEIPVVVVGAEHFVAAAEEVTTDDLTGEQLVRPHASGWRPRAEQLDWPAMSEKDAIETVVAGTGVVIVPMSVARLFQRKDATYRPVVDLEPTKIGLAWRIDNEDDRIQDFIGVVRGRTANSSRGR